MPEPTPVEEALIYALHSFSEAKARWSARRSKGLDEQGLKEAISYELGIQGGRGGWGRIPEVSYRGGNNPAVWIGSAVCHAKPTYQGRALLEAVRRLMKIPLPGKVYYEQLELGFVGQQTPIPRSPKDCKLRSDVL